MGLDVAPVPKFRLPDTLRNWPWARDLNVHYLECKTESTRWCEAFKAFSPNAQIAFNLCDFNLLAGLAYPLHDKDGLRIGCDLMNLFFIIDEHTDVADHICARLQADIVMAALRNPYTTRPDGEWIGGEATRQYVILPFLTRDATEFLSGMNDDPYIRFWANAIKHSTPTSQRRFIKSFQLYLDAVVQEAKDRSHNHIRSIPHYMEVRRDTIGAKPSFAILEIQMNLSDEVFNHPTIQKITLATIDMLILGNDMCSYNVEHAREKDRHNIVTVVMHELKTNITSALDWISSYHDELVAQFMTGLNNIPSWGHAMDVQVARYVDGLGNWVRANDSWSFETQRYFGKSGLEIQKTRVVDMQSHSQDNREICI